MEQDPQIAAWVENPTSHPLHGEYATRCNTTVPAGVKSTIWTSVVHGVYHPDAGTKNAALATLSSSLSSYLTPVGGNTSFYSGTGV
jgi:hypothetical protein